MNEDKKKRGAQPDEQMPSDPADDAATSGTPQPQEPPPTEPGGGGIPDTKNPKP